MTVLRPYQETGVDQLVEKLPIADKGVVYCAPTGAGKTKTATRVVKTFDVSSIFFVHRKELLEQTAESYRADGLDFGLVSPEHDFRPETHVIASIDTMIARLARYEPVLRRAKLFVFDEAHHAVAQNWLTIREMAPDAMLLGPSATPWRTNGKGLGECFDDVVMAPSVKALTEMGWLAPARIFKPPLKLNSLAGVKKRLGDYALNELSKAVNLTEVNQAVVAYHLAHARHRPTVVFCVDVQHAEDVCRAFRIGGYKAVVIKGDMHKRDRNAAINGLKDGSIEILVSVDVVSEGLDVPRVACAVLLRPTLSTGLYLQRIGRVLRPDDEFEDALIIDAVGNSIEHGLPDEIRPWTLLEGAKNMERMVMKPTRCGYCYRVQRASNACVECGKPLNLTLTERMVIESKQPLSPGLANCSHEVLATLGTNDLLKLGKTRADLEFIAAVRGYKPGWVDQQISMREYWRTSRSFG